MQTLNDIIHDQRNPISSQGEYNGSEDGMSLYSFQQQLGLYEQFEHLLQQASPLEAFALGAYVAGMQQGRQQSPMVNPGRNLYGRAQTMPPKQYNQMKGSYVGLGTRIDYLNDPATAVGYKSLPGVGSLPSSSMYQTGMR